MTKSAKNILTALACVLVICAMGIGICCACGAAAGDTTLSTESAAHRAGYDIQVGEYFASEYQQTTAGDYVYKVYCDSCSGSGYIDGDLEECPAGCTHVTPYALSGFWEQCDACSGAGKIVTGYGKHLAIQQGLSGTYCGLCGDRMYTTLGECKRHPQYSDCSACSGSGNPGYIWRTCDTCDGEHYVLSEDTECEACSGKGYFWMRGAKAIDCATCHGYCSLIEEYTVACEECEADEHQTTTGHWVRCTCGNSASDGACGTCEDGKVTCSTCDGVGAVPGSSTSGVWGRCPTCDGAGTVDCSDCAGTGVSSCTDCHGTCEVTCSHCGGAGYTKYKGNGEWWAEKHGCTYCGGHGATSVWGGDYQAGTGKVTCTECHGACQEGYVWEACDLCLGLGTITYLDVESCPDCAGRGWVDETPAGSIKADDFTPGDGISAKDDIIIAGGIKSDVIIVDRIGDITTDTIVTTGSDEATAPEGEQSTSDSSAGTVLEPTIINPVASTSFGGFSTSTRAG